jgi:hypothetical protein
MNLPEFIYDIIEFTVEGEAFETELFEQLEILSVKEEEHTGIGLFVYFNHSEELENLKANYKCTEKNVDGDPIYDITKILLVNDSVKVLADTTVHITNGIIDCVEIWNKIGPFPEGELITYELKRLPNG